MQGHSMTNIFGSLHVAIALAKYGVIIHYGYLKLKRPTQNISNDKNAMLFTICLKMPFLLFKLLLLNVYV